MVWHDLTLDLTGLRFDKLTISVAEVEWRSNGQISFPEATTKGSGVDLSSLRFGVQAEADFLALATKRGRAQEAEAGDALSVHYHRTI